MYFRNYRLIKTGLRKCLKAIVPEHHSIINMLKGRKDCLNIYPFYFFVWSLNWEKLNCRASLLVIAEILGLFANILIANVKYSLYKGRVYCNQFKCNYLRNQNIFANFLLHISNIHKILNILKKKELHSWYISKNIDFGRRGYLNF